MGSLVGLASSRAGGRTALRGRCAVVVLVLALAVVVGACGAADDTSEGSLSTQSPTDADSAAGYEPTSTSPSTSAAPDAAGAEDAGGDTTTTGGNQVNANPTVLIKTSIGDITAELDAAAAPLTVENFLGYVEDGHYDGTIFHRVIPGFMIQGGGFTSDMQQKPTEAPVKNEADNGLKNLRGTLAMARTGVVDSATSQFFINVVDNQFLDYAGPSPQTYGYAVFGRVTSGMDVVDAIVAVPTTTVGSFQNVPQSPVLIESISVAQ